MYEFKTKIAFGLQKEAEQWSQASGIRAPINGVDRFERNRSGDCRHYKTEACCVGRQAWCIFVSEGPGTERWGVDCLFAWDEARPSEYSGLLKFITFLGLNRGINCCKLGRRESVSLSVPFC